MQQSTGDTNMCRSMMNAIIQWQIDAGLAQTIHVVTDTRYYDASALERRIDNNRHLVLSIGSNAVRHFRYNENDFTFEGRFDGVVMNMAVPYTAVLGFTIPVSENEYGFFPIPNMERIQHQLIEHATMLKHIEMLKDSPGLQGVPGIAGGNPAKPIEPTPFAVVGVDTHDSEGNELPTRQELMARQSLEKRDASTGPIFAANASGRKAIETSRSDSDETGEPKPLLDFGNVGGPSIPKHQSRYKGKPTLTVIQGGKKD